MAANMFNMAMAAVPADRSLGPEAAQKWKSVRPGKVSWNFAEVESLAKSWLAEMPQRAVDIILKKNIVAGSHFVKLESEISRPGFKEIGNNFVWLKPVCTMYPRRVPSAFLLTDAFLILDEMLAFSLLVPPQNDTREVVAGREAKRVKRCVGALRSLYRSSDSSPDDRVHALKQLLEASPHQKAKQDASDDDSLGGVFSEDSEAESEKPEGEDALVPYPPPVSPRPSDSDEFERSDSEKDFAVSDEKCHSKSEDEKHSSDSENIEKHSPDSKDIEKHSPDSEDIEKHSPDSEDTASDEEKDVSGSAKQSVHLHWGRAKSTPNLGAVCPHESSDDDASASGGDGYALVEVKNEDDESADASDNDSDSDSQATLVLGESRKKRQKMMPDDVEASKVPHDLQSELFHAGHRAVSGRACKPSSAGMRSLQTPSCKSKGLAGLEVLTPEPVPLANKRTKVPRTNKTEPCEAEKTIKKKKKEARKLASFKRHNSRKVLKKALKNRVRSNIKALRALKDKEKARAAEHPPADREAGSGDSGEASTSDMYEDYSLKHLPLATRPQDRKNTGKHSYSLKSARGRGTIEVLLRHHAFMVKIVDESAPGPKGQVSWTKHEPADAWQIAKERAGYVEP